MPGACGADRAIQGAFKANVDGPSSLGVGGFVNAVPGFTDVPLVVNGASDLIVEVFGEAGRHARTAVGVAELPAG